MRNIRGKCQSMNLQQWMTMRRSTMKESLLILNRCISPSPFCNWSSKAPIQDRRSQRLVVGFCRTSLCWMTHWNATQKNVSSSNNLLCVWWCLEKYRFISSKGVLVLRYQDTRHNRTGSVLISHMYGKDESGHTITIVLDEASSCTYFLFRRNNTR